MERWKVKTAASYRGAMSNARGRQFEAMIDAGCRYYRMHGIASIEKTPEPFRCLHKGAGGIAKVQFMSHAQPDYKGVLKGGQAIVFEAKTTEKDRILQDVLTEKQAGELEMFRELGAESFVCCGIQGRFFMVPYTVWSNFKLFFGRKYATANDLRPWRVCFDGAVKFLDSYRHRR